MLLTSVILILQEILEAALLISILAVLSRRQGYGLGWLYYGLAAGGLFAWLYASNMRYVSEWWDYAGQEVVNAALQISIAAAIVALSWLICPARPGARHFRLFFLLAALTIGLAVTREGSEIGVYLGGFLSQPEKLQPVLIGGAIGAGIGLSIGFLVYYGLMALPGNAGTWTPLVLLALFCGNMLSQSAVQLTQVSSAWLPEHSMPGRLLYALIGYESTPSAVEVSAYLAGVLAVATSVALGRRPQ